MKKKFYQQTWFLWVMGIFIPVVGIILLWTVHRKKTTGFKIGLTVGFSIWFLICLGISQSSDSNTSNNKTPSNQVAEINVNDNNTKDDGELSGLQQLEALRKELKDKYGVNEPTSFVRGDNTGKWKIVDVANATPPSEYAVDYARAYMFDGDVHYIVNFSLKTTTQLRMVSGKLSVIVTEYVDGEEHDASVIGQGLQYVEKYYDVATGEEITTEADESAGTVVDGDLVSAVNAAIEGAVGKGEKITDVSFDGSDLKVTVDLSETDTSRLSVELIAESRVSSITDNILALDDSYYNTWDTVTVDFGSVGSITFDKNDVKDNGFGRYFDVPINYFE